MTITSWCAALAPVPVHYSADIQRKGRLIPFIQPIQRAYSIECFDIGMQVDREAALAMSTQHGSKT